MRCLLFVAVSLCYLDLVDVDLYCVNKGYYVLTQNELDHLRTQRPANIVSEIATLQVS